MDSCLCIHGGGTCAGGWGRGGVEAHQDYVEVVFEVVGEGVHGFGLSTNLDEIENSHLEVHNSDLV